MAKLTITVSQVRPTVGDPTALGFAAEVITIGSAVAYAADLDKWTLAQGSCDDQYAGAEGYGIALTHARAFGQPLIVALPEHRVTLGAGAAPEAGKVYFIGDTAGGLHLASDLGSGDKVTAMGVGLTSNRILIFGGSYDAGAVLA